ncbi:MAG: ABC transporter substrate-binding protein [Chloroflexi bacterium]|nr:ABC transporter substrate-binding protein [Chloroflexota bacterium]
MTRALALLIAIVMAACTGPGAGAPPSASPAPAPTPTPERIVFMAGFKPQANLPFVAVYVAQERGWFKEQGLEVEIRHATSSEHVQLLATGRVQFSTGSTSDILKRVATADVPLVAIAQIGQRGEQALAVLADSPIRTPKDFEGKLVGYKGTVSADYLAILRAAGVDRAKVREVSVGFDPRVLIEKKVDVYPVFEANEPDTLARLGAPVRLFHPNDFGIPSLGLTFMTTRDLVDTRPDLVKRFLAAAMRGLDEAVRDPGAAIDITMKYAVGEDPAHQRYMLDREIAAAQNDLTRQRGIGAIPRERWAEVYKLLLDFGVLPKAIDVSRVIDDRAITEVRSGR